MSGTARFTLLFCGLMVAVISDTVVSEHIGKVDDLGKKRESDVRTFKYMCPWGWSPYATRCFKFIDTARTWTESEQYCVMIGGNLASVHNKEEDLFIKNLVRHHTRDTRITWIGGHDATQEGLWLWSDGSSFDFTQWYPGEPNNYAGREHCLVINFKDLLGWNDGQCSDMFSSVCSRYP